MSLSMEYKSLVMEVRPRLQSVNVYIILLKPNQIVINLHLDHFIVKIGQVCHKINCKDFRIVPNSLSCFTNKEEQVTFRFMTENLQQNLGTSQCELVQFLPDSFCLKQDFLIKENCFYSVSCTACSQLLNKVSFEKVLPLPESSDSSDWYCHAGTDHVKMVPKSTQILYSDCFVYVNPTVLDVLADDLTLYCKNCEGWIGTNEKGAFKIWFNTVTFSNEIETYSSVALYDIIKTIKILHNSPFGFVKVLLKCLDSKTEMDVILLWVIEKNLTVYFNDDKAIVFKVLFRSERPKSDIALQWMSDVNVTVYDISKLMLLKLCEHLYFMNSYIPEDYNSSNNFFVSYIVDKNK